MDVLYGCHGLFNNCAFSIMIFFSRTINVWISMYLIVKFGISICVLLFFSGTNKNFLLVYAFPKGLACACLISSFFHYNFLQVNPLPSLCLSFLCSWNECFTSVGNGSNWSYKCHLFPWTVITMLTVHIRAVGSTADWGKHHWLLASTNYLLIYISWKKGMGALTVCIIKRKNLLKVCRNMGWLDDDTLSLLYHEAVFKLLFL